MFMSKLDRKNLVPELQENVNSRVGNVWDSHNFKFISVPLVFKGTMFLAFIHL